MQKTRLRPGLFFAVSEVFREYESQWAAITSIAAKIDCRLTTLRRWVRQHELDTGQRPRRTIAKVERIDALERKVLELRKAN